jgi:proteasome lid subunit RPN8/RPN11
MGVRISSELRRLILAEAAASPGAEVCGLLLGRGGRVEAVLPARNVAAEPARRFEIDPATLLAAHRQARGGGAPILGCYHSHPSGSAEPSPCDAAEAAPNGWLWLIAGGGAIRAWRATTDGACHGRFDEEPLADDCPGDGGGEPAAAACAVMRVVLLPGREQCAPADDGP